MKSYEQLRQTGSVRVVDETGPETDPQRRKRFVIQRLNSQTYIATAETRTGKVRSSRIVTRAELEALLNGLVSENDFEWAAGANILNHWKFENYSDEDNYPWIRLEVPSMTGTVYIRISASIDQWSNLIENLKEELR